MTADSDKPRLTVVADAPDSVVQILLVDPDEAAAFPLRRAAERTPTAHIRHVRTAEEATALLPTQQWDLVVVDPIIDDGFVLLKHVKDHYRWVATLVVSHARSPQFLRHAVKCRIDGLLFKPVTAEEFLEQSLLLADAVHERRLRQQRRVLAVGAHPDDVEIGCGGSLAKHHVKGDVLHILTLSRGAAGGDTNVRTAEAQQAARILGATLKFGNLTDTNISEGAETISIIEAAIRELRPTHVYTHCSEDTHQDHRAAHAATLVAARSVPNVYLYQSPSATVEFRPNRFVDITEHIREKLQAIAAYKSQVDRMESLQEDVIITTARYWGRFAGYVLAEPMRIVRQRDGDMSPDAGKEAAAGEAAATASEVA
ncbi:MAG: PIG-L family deacetylase [Reyranellaceae bacterium]